MKENKLVTMVIIITIVSILLVFGGITFAYFSAFNNQGSTAQATIDTGKMLITYNDGTDNILPVTNIQPSDKILVNKTFSLTGTNTATGMAAGDGLVMPYKVGLKYKSTFSDGQIHYYIKRTTTNENVTANYVVTPEDGKTKKDYLNQTIPGNDTYTGYTHGTLKKGNKYTEMVTGEFKANQNEQSIEFNLIIQFPDTGLNQDSEKGATINGKIVVNYEPPTPTTFAADSWETIAAVVQDGQLEAYPVGSEKEVEIGGKNYTVRVANNTTPKECNDLNFSQTACGFVVEFVDIVENRNMNPSGEYKGTQYNYGWNVDGWPASAMRTYANGDFLKKLPSDLQDVIIKTNVVSGHGSTSGETNFTSTDKIYLLSGHEVWEDASPSTTSLSARDTAYNNTRQLDYYKDQEVTTNSYTAAIKKTLTSSSGSWWWLRAAYSTSGSTFFSVSDAGNVTHRSAYSNIGFAPAFRIG